MRSDAYPSTNRHPTNLIGKLTEFWINSSKMNFILSIIMIILWAFPSFALGDDDYYDEIKSVQASTSSAQMEMKAIRECPLLVSKNLPFDYKERYNETLALKFLFGIYRFVGINDVQQMLSFVGMVSMFYTFYNCGFENGRNISYTLNGQNQWIPRLYHDSAFEHVDLPKQYEILNSFFSLEANFLLPTDF